MTKVMRDSSHGVIGGYSCVHKMFRQEESPHRSSQAQLLLLIYGQTFSLLTFCPKLKLAACL